MFMFVLLEEKNPIPHVVKLSSTFAVLFRCLPAVLLHLASRYRPKHPLQEVTELDVTDPFGWNLQDYYKKSEKLDDGSGDRCDAQFLFESMKGKMMQ